MTGGQVYTSEKEIQLLFFQAKKKKSRLGNIPQSAFFPTNFVKCLMAFSLCVCVCLS